MIEACICLALDKVVTVLSVSDSIEILLGYSPDDFLSARMTLAERIHPQDQDIASRLFAPDLEEISGSVNIRLRQANGRIRCVRAEFAKTVSDTGSLILDLRLQDAKSLERTLDDASMTINFRAMMENTDDYIYFKDRNHVFTGASQTLVALCSPAEHWSDLLGKTDYDVFPEEFADIYYALEKQVFAGMPVAHEVQETLTNDGKRGWVDNRKYPICNAPGEIIGLYGIARDITGLKEAEFELRRHRTNLEMQVDQRTHALSDALEQIRINEERYGFALEATHDGIWDWNLETGINHVNPAFCKMLGFLPEDIGEDVQRNFVDLLHPDERQHVLETAHQQLETAGGYEMEFRMCCKDGGYKWILSRGKVFARDSAGHPLRAVGTHIDLTVRKQLEEVTKEVALYTRSLIESSLDPLVTINIEGKITDVNLATERVTGVSRENLIGSDFADFFTNPEQARLGYQQAFSLGFVTDYPLAIRDVFGQVTDVLYNASVYRDPRGNVIGVFAAARDITVQKKALAELEQHRNNLEELVTTRTEELALRLSQMTEINNRLEETRNQLLQSEKMASIGQLAAGVAHEINNPIGFVNSNLGTLKVYIDGLFEIVAVCEAVAVASANSSDLERIRGVKASNDFDYLKTDIFQLLAESNEGLQRVKHIVQDLKDFSRPGDSNWQWADLHAGLDSTLNIVWNELKYKCTVIKDFGELPEIYCMPSQLNQVFMNLLVNAAHAILEKGEINIRSGRQGAEVFVAISDTGKGISSENLSRIYDPFFTTKPVGEGTGLGLSITYGIVQKHQGRIEVASEPGKGTTFTVWLPIEARGAGTIH